MNPALGLLFLHGYVATPTGVAALTHTPTESTKPGPAPDTREAANLDLDDCAIAC
jgi:hypothetical protein